MMLLQYVCVYINDCLQKDSIQNYLNARVKRKSGYIQKGNNVSKSIIQTNIGDDSDTVTNNNKGK